MQVLAGAMLYLKLRPTITPTNCMCSVKSCPERLIVARALTFLFFFAYAQHVEQRVVPLLANLKYARDADVT